MVDSDRVLWIGGSPCGGKSTVAHLLAATRGLRVHSCDDGFDQHAVQVDAATGPTLKKLTGLSIADRLAQPIDRQVEDVFRAYREEFPLILRDAMGVPRRIEDAATSAIPWCSDDMVSFERAIRQGELDVVSDAVHRLTGTAPRSFCEVAAERCR